MSDKLYQCKSCGARVLQSTYPDRHPHSCPKCEAQNWVELRGYKSGRTTKSKDWMGRFTQALSNEGNQIRWR